MGLPVIENFEVWVSAPKMKKSSGRGKKGVKAAPGINALKGLILNFAVQGKLTSRNPKAEKAAELLLRVNKKWDGLKRNRIPKEAVEKVSNVSSLPENWVSTCLNEIALLGPKNVIADDQPASFVPMPLITTSLDGRHDFEERMWGSIKKGYTHFANGDIGLAKITPCFENSKAAVFSGLINDVGTGTTELHVARPISPEIDPKFILLVLKSNHFLTNGISRMTGTAGQKRVPRWYFQFYEFGLPPLEEQQRIVAKVDELMGLIDDLEAQTETARESHAELVDALLRTLVESEDANALTHNWQTLSAHFDTLFTTEKSVAKLRAAVLDLMVRGSLCKTRLPKERAEAYLFEVHNSRILEKDKTKDKRITKNHEPDSTNLIINGAPNWVTTSFANFFLFIDYRGRTPKKTQSGVPLITAKNIRMGHLNRNPAEYIALEDFDDWMTRGFPEEGDLFFTTEAPLGNICINNIEEKFAIAQRLICMQPFIKKYDPYFFIYMIMSPPFQKMLFTEGTGMTAKGIKAGRLKSLPIFLPCFEEQKIIVEKVDELMGLCEGLLRNIRTSEALKVELAESVVHHASEG